jgi:MinD-like ATPase involved in chromosome partitioning or flagellar assembly
MESTLGEIITFYSYKGGAGRSMALANVACLLAQKQEVDKDILMIDWDLEAPGLHQFFHGRFDDTRDGQGNLPSGQLGLIDLFYEIRNRLEKSKPQENFLEDIFLEVDIQKYIAKVNHLPLFLMPAGKFDDWLYSTRVNEFDWATFFDNFPLVIAQFAQYLRKKFSYVLIDSRTGYTDTSGICTSLMPEKLVTVFTPNRQSLSGVVELIRRALDYRKHSDDLRPLMIFPLPSRIENAESKLQKEWRFGDSSQGVEGYQTQLESVLKDVYGLQICDLTEYFDENQLQYVPRYSYGEEIAVLSERSEDRLSLARSFENFAEKITSNENPWETIKDLSYLDELDVPGGSVRLNDPFYIERDVDEKLKRSIIKIGETITIRGSRQTGKSSLLVRGIHYVRSTADIVHFDFQGIEHDVFESLDSFLKYFAETVARKLKMDSSVVNQIWQSNLGPSGKLTRVFEEYILQMKDGQTVLVMDEVDRLLSTSFYSDFFSLLRSWHNNRAFYTQWNKLNLVMVIATEPYLLIAGPSQSPFNVGIQLDLKDFNREQVWDLNNRHGGPITENDFETFFELLGGHPFLTRKALYLLVTENLTWKSLYKDAADDHGPFADHLRRQLWLLRTDKALTDALKEIIRENKCSNDKVLWRLSRGGLVKGRGDLYYIRCGLYERYFQEHLK